MRLKLKRYIVVSLSIIAIMFLGGCSTIEKIEKKLGVRNEYFDFINSDNIDKITVQSNRDKGFKFTITEDSAINDMHTLLAKSKSSKKSTELEPDFIFEFHVGEDVRRFYYVVGATEGNFYNEGESFTVSKRLDEGIIQNMSFVRMPRDFDYVYYNSVLKVLEILQKEKDLNNLKVGINIQGDIDCLKYVYSVQVNKFLQDAKKIAPSTELVNNDEENFDLVLNVKNRGYDSTNFKTKIFVNNKVDKIINQYYITAINQYKEWDIDVSKMDEVPKNW